MAITEEERARIRTALAVTSPIVVNGQAVEITLEQDVESVVGPKQYAFRFRGVSGDATYHADLHIGEWNAHDVGYVVANAEHAMRETITGNLPPGTKAIL